MGPLGAGCGVDVIKSASKRVLAAIVRFMRAHSGLKRRLVGLFSHFPVLDRLVLRLSRRVIEAPPEDSFRGTAQANGIPILSTSARKIYESLVREIGRNPH